MTRTNARLYLKSGSRYRLATAPEVCEAASNYLIAAAVKERPNLSSPRAARNFLAAQAGLDVEQFGIVFLDNRHRLIDVLIVSTGTIDGASVHPREIAKHALQSAAAAVICFHNHPSGIAEPSMADEAITQRLKEALALLDIRLLDHLIVARDSVVSLAERGLC
jgi:DNA repair protein RadC